MKSRICRISILSLAILIGLTTVPLLGASKENASNHLKWKMVWLWSMSDKSDAEVVSAAKSLGFNAIEVRGPKMVDECHKQGIQAVGLLHFACAPKNFAQVISTEEEKRFNQNKKLIQLNNQYGGEPLTPCEILTEDNLWCFDRPEALDYGKKEVDKLISEGCDAIGLDYIGYRNYHACYCTESIAKQEQYQKAHPKLSHSQAVDAYSRECLVSFYTKLINYAKSKKPNIVVTAHIYPYFAPDPVYGNRIPLDYCGQTVSWFFIPHWGYDKIRKYTNKVVHEAGKYHSKCVGAPFIGIYTLPPYNSHRKSPERLREEIRIIKESGSTAIQMAELGNIINDSDLACVVREELNSEHPQKK